MKNLKIMEKARDDKSLGKPSNKGSCMIFGNIERNIILVFGGLIGFVSTLAM